MSDWTHNNTSRKNMYTFNASTTLSNTRDLKTETCKKSDKTVEHGKISSTSITEEYKLDKTKQKTFAAALQEALDSEARNTTPLVNAQLKCNMELNTNKTTPKHNVGGNINLKFDIPCTNGELPNYVEMLLSNTAVLESYPILKILLSIFTSADLLSTYYFNKDQNTTNNVPSIDLSKNLSTSTVNQSFGWNVNRNYTADSAKAMLNYHAQRINQFIDYILKNNVASAGPEAQAIWTSLFGTQSGNNVSVYSHALNTLLLPSLVNYFASAGTKKENPDASVKDNACTDYKFSHSQAISYAGYVPVGCEFFPIYSTNDLDKMTYFNEATNTPTCSWDINAAYNFNHRWSGSVNNHPLIKTNRTRSVVTDTPKIEGFDYMKNIPLKYNGTEKYAWNKSVEAMNKISTFAKQHVGTKTSSSKWGLITDYGCSTQPTVPFREISEHVQYVHYNTGCSNYYPRSYVESCEHCWHSFLSGPEDCTKREESGPTSSPFEQRRVFKENSDALKEWALKRLKSGPQIGNDSYTVTNIKYLVANISEKLVIEPGVFSSQFTEGTTVPVKQSGGTWCDDGPTRQCRVCIYTDKTIGQKYPSLVSMDNTTPVKITYDHRHNGMMHFYTLMGSFYLNSKEFYVETQDNSAESLKKMINHIYTICLFKTEKDLVLLSDYSYVSWFYIVRSMVNTDKVIKEIRKFAYNNPHLLLSAKCNDKFGEYIRNTASSGDYMYFNIPISTMIVKIPNSEVVPNRYYVPEVKFESLDTTWKNSRDTVDGVNVNTFDRFGTMSTSNNYLDLVLKGLIDNAYQAVRYDGTDVFCVMLPSRGKQLFEVIDKSIVTLLPSSYVIKHSKYTNSKSELYNDNTKIVFSTFDFNSNNTTKVLLDKYTFVNMVNAPRFTVKKNTDRNVYECEIVAKNNDGNNIYVYVSKDKNSEMVPVAENRTVGKVVNKNVRISYNGIDANITPMCLKKKVSFF